MTFSVISFDFTMTYEVGKAHDYPLFSNIQRSYKTVKPSGLMDMLYTCISLHDVNVYKCSFIMLCPDNLCINNTKKQYAQRDK